ncbi:MAG: alpha/beta hydrolase [Verrucomicrobiota bacterium]
MKRGMDRWIKWTLWYVGLTLIGWGTLGCDGDGGGGGGLRFRVDGDQAFVSGNLGEGAPGQVDSFLRENPDVSTLVLVDLPGSSDDDANLAAARMVRAAGLDTHVPANGGIFSGGVDFFLAGVRRTVEPGAELGVHSWAEGDVQGRDLPRDDPAHQVYLDYYRDMGIPTSFYWFTLDAAPVESIHTMSEAEMRQFRVITN